MCMQRILLLIHWELKEYIIAIIMQSSLFASPETKLLGSKNQIFTCYLNTLIFWFLTLSKWADLRCVWWTALMKPRLSGVVVQGRLLSIFFKLSSHSALVYGQRCYITCEKVYLSLCLACQSGKGCQFIWRVSNSTLITPFISLTAVTINVNNK